MPFEYQKHQTKNDVQTLTISYDILIINWNGIPSYVKAESVM